MICALLKLAFIQVYIAKSHLIRKLIGLFSAHLFPLKRKVVSLSIEAQIIVCKRLEFSNLFNHSDIRVIVEGT